MSNQACRQWFTPIQLSLSVSLPEDCSALESEPRLLALQLLRVNSLHDPLQGSLVSTPSKLASAARRNASNARSLSGLSNNRFHPKPSSNQQGRLEHRHSRPSPAPASQSGTVSVCICTTKSSLGILPAPCRHRPLQPLATLLVDFSSAW